MYNEFYEKFSKVVKINGLLSVKVKCVILGDDVLRPPQENILPRGIRKF